MGAVSYTIKTFNPEEAASGALCIVLNYTQYNNIGNNANVVGVIINPDATYIDDQSHEVSLIVGTGICKRRGDLFTITINSTNYTFDSDGTGYSGTARGKYLYRCEVVDSTTVTNNVTSTTNMITRAGDGTISTGTLTTAANILIENLTARDEFAAQALRGILGRIDNPSVLSKDELKFYCDAAYKWAEGMLQEAAKSRAVGSITTVSGTSTSSYSDNTEALLAQIAAAIGNISISGGSGGSIDTATLVAVLDKMLYTIKSEGRWHYHTAIDINGSGQFKFVYRPIYGRAQVKLEYYDSNGNLLPESTVTNWVGKRYTASDVEIQDGDDLTKTYSQLIDMMMTDSAVADSEGYYYKATPQYPFGSNVTVASVKVFVDVNSINVSGGGSATDVSGIEDALGDLTSAVKEGDYPSLAASLATMMDLGQGVPLRNYTDTNNEEVPLQVSGKFAGAISNERVTPQGGGNPRKDPFLVQLDDNSLGRESGHEIYTKNSVSFEANQGIKVSEQVTGRQVSFASGAGINVTEQNEDRTVSFASGASVGVSGTVTIGGQSLGNSEQPLTVRNDSNSQIRVRNWPNEVFNVECSGDGFETVSNSLFSASDWQHVCTITRNNFRSAFEIEHIELYRTSDIKIVLFDVNGNVLGNDTAKSWKTRWHESNGDAGLSYITLSLFDIANSLKSRNTGDIDGEGYIEVIPTTNPSGTAVDDEDFESTIMTIKVYIKNSGSSFSGAITSIPALHIGSTSAGLGENSNNPFYVSMPGYLPLSDVGVINGKVLRLVEFPNYGSIKSNGNCNQNYIPNTDANTDTQAYFMGLTRWVMINYHDSGMVTLMGSANPNSCGTAIFNLYSDHGYGQSGVTGADTTMPLHCSGVYFAYSGLIISFGTREGVWYYREIDTSYIMAAVASVAEKAWQLRGANRSSSDSTPSTYMPSLNSGELAYVYSELALAGGAVSNRYEQRVTFAPWQDYSGGLPVQLSFVGDNGNSGFGGMFIRAASSISTWGSWEQIATSSNSFVKVGGKLLENIDFMCNSPGYYGVQFYSGPSYFRGKLSLNSNYELAYTDENGNTKKVLLEGNTFQLGSGTINGDVTITGISENGVYTPYKLKFGGTSSNYISSHPIDDGLYIHCGADCIEFVSNDNNGSQAIFNMEALFRNSYGSSDVRLKNILSKRVFDAEDIAKLSLINYTWKEGKDKAVHFGSTAQEWEKVIPEVVHENKNGIKAMDYGAAAMAAGVTACREIVELKEENKELKKRVSYLEKELEAIKEIVYGKKENDMED